MMERLDVIPAEIDDVNPNEFLCPITQEIMEDPVLAPDGHTYERAAIEECEEWFKRDRRSPATNLPLPSIELIPNIALRKLIQDSKVEMPKLAQYKLNEENMLAAVKLHEEEMKRLLEYKDQLLEQEKKRNAVLGKELEETQRCLQEQALKNTLHTLDKLISMLDEINMPTKRSVPQNSYAPSAPPASVVTPPLRPILNRPSLLPLSPLETWFEAARNRHLERMEWLLAHGTPIDIRDNNNTALHIAASGGRLIVVKWLLAKGASIEATNNEGDTALHMAAMGGYLDVVKRLLEKGASAKAINNEGDTPLLIAAWKGNLDIVKCLLIEGGASVHEKDNTGATALLLAAFEGHFNVVKWLLTEGGADANDRNNAGRSAFGFCVRHHNEIKEFVKDARDKQLEELKKDPKLFSETLFAAVKEGHDHKVEWLTSSRLVYEGDVNNNTAFLMAIRYGHVIIMQRFANRKSLKVKDENGNTALLIAASYDHLEIVKWLLLKGYADINEQNDNKQKAFNLASNPEVKKFLEEFSIYSREKNSWLGFLSKNQQNQKFQAWSDSCKALKTGWHI